MLLISMRVNERWCSKFGFRIHLINESLILLLSDLSFEFESGGKFTTWNTEINWNQLELSHMSCS